VCRIRVNHWRSRKTGPRFALCIVECVTHRCIFTLYPPGHMPYGRVAMAPVAVDGEPLRDVAGGCAWDLTLFRAARDAARGIAWPRVLGPGDAARGQESWRTQRRRIVVAALLLGALAESTHTQPAVAEKLGIPTLVVRDTSAAFQTPGWRRYGARGRALVPVLDALAPDCMLERLHAAGVLVEMWGVARRWDTECARPRVRGPP
jgi:hypothetical protein